VNCQGDYAGLIHKERVRSLRIRTSLHLASCEPGTNYFFRINATIRAVMLATR